MGLPVSRLPDEGHLTRGDLSGEDIGFKSDPAEEVCESQSQSRGAGAMRGSAVTTQSPEWERTN